MVNGDVIKHNVIIILVIVNENIDNGNVNMVYGNVKQLIELVSVVYGNVKQNFVNENSVYGTVMISNVNDPVACDNVKQDYVNEHVVCGNLRENYEIEEVVYDNEIGEIENVNVVCGIVETEKTNVAEEIGTGVLYIEKKVI